MRTEVLNKNNLELYRELIPGALDSVVFTQGIHTVGALFAETEAGLAIWRDKEGQPYGELMSLFVLPEARRMGIGEYLLEHVVEDMKKAGKEGICAKYLETGDRSLLTPFLSEMGIETERMETPVGRVTVGEALKAVDKVAGKLEECGSPVSELAGRNKAATLRWIEDLCGEDARQYMTGKPESFVILEDGEVKSALLFRKEDETTISLDYAFSSDPKSLLGLLKLAERTFATEMEMGINIEMLLATQAGKGLYEKLMGEPSLNCTVVECQGNFSNL
ncbi:MAG: GNAT family N-acetyltransferase [Lachnospiraceae bacterium]|nr:GNAT family N-acetyltransferase [Lachnospiraceae bacterium]